MAGSGENRGGGRDAGDGSAGVAAATAGADCVLCPPLRFRFNQMAGLPGAGAVLDRDADFFLIPDLAPLVTGHVLLVTEAHHVCAGAFPPRLWTAARAWRDVLVPVLHATYGGSGATLLEHGPATSQGGGACIDHAHWHLLPGGGVRAVVEGEGLRGVPAVEEEAMARYAEGRSYLLVEEDGVGRIYPGERAPGQFLRWAAATALDGRPARVWRWQELFGLPGSRARFLRTLGDLRGVTGPAGGAGGGQAPDASERDSHQ